ncbi:MAG: Eco29kI family restriction endonuclease [Planctomycetes bacterium]|nr:Eco29kI family restriction endonuclease [Planctomycetota bacterium]
MPEPIDYDRLATALEELLACVPTGGIDASGLATRRAKKLVAEIRQAIQRLRELAHAIDPVRQPPTMLDPYQPEVLGRLIGETMQEQPRHALASLHDFYGSGVYALYYRGQHAAYTPIGGKNTPIYAGKADPPTPLAATPEDQGPRLSIRLREHAKSIRAATNLSIDDFDCRFLVVKSGLQKAAEDFLLNYFRPIWNQPICKGFGKHGDDPGTRSNTRSEWDTLHPGRAWASRAGNTPNPKTPDQIMAEIAAHFARTPPRE